MSTPGNESPVDANLMNAFMGAMLNAFNSVAAPKRNKKQEKIDYAKNFVHALGGPNTTKSTFVGGKNLQLKFDFNAATNSLLIFSGNYSGDWNICTNVNIHIKSGEGLIEFDHPDLGRITLHPNNGFINGTTDGSRNRGQCESFIMT